MAWQQLKPGSFFKILSLTRYNFEIMKMFLRSLSLLVFLLSLQPPTLTQAQAATPPVEAESGAVVCAPGDDLSGDCLALGPAQSVQEMQRMGLSYPPAPLPVRKPEEALNIVPYLYYKITEPFTSLYPSLEAAQQKSGALQQIGPGKLLYLVYNAVVETPRGTYFQLPSGAWMHGDGTRVSVPVFQGVELYATPRNAFGWVISEAQVHTLPSYDPGTLLGESLPRNSLVQVYQSIRVEGNDWVLIGFNRWVENRLVGIVTPQTTPPAGVTGSRWIDVNLAEQTLAVYDHNRMVFATLMASGLDPYWTRPGVFQIYKKKETENMSGAFEADRSDYYYLENVPYTMYFDKARALHGAYWRAMFGYPQSHGCVNLSVGDAAWVFGWASEGDWVYVHDPSGVTPTDPAFYGDGGA